MKKIIALLLTSMTLMAAGSQDGENRVVRIINRSSQTIKYLYASNVSSKSWEEDILGSGRVLGPNRYLNANLDDGTGHCLYDLRAVMADGRVAESRRFNVCTQGTWTVVD